MAKGPATSFVRVVFGDHRLCWGVPPSAQAGRHIERPVEEPGELRRSPGSSTGQGPFSDRAEILNPDPDRSTERKRSVPLAHLPTSMWEPAQHARRRSLLASRPTVGLPREDEGFDHRSFPYWNTYSDTVDFYQSECGTGHYIFLHQDSTQTLTTSIR